MIGVPVQVTPPLVKLGVILTVAVKAMVPVLVAVMAGMLPVPLADRPVNPAGAVIVQLYVVVPPVLLVPKVTAVVLAPLQIVWLLTVLT